LRAFSKGDGEMQENGANWEPTEYLQSPDAVRHLWEGTRKALDGGIDTKDLVSLCDIIVRLADHRLLTIQAAPHSAEAEEAAKQIRHYLDLAAEVLQRASKPAPEPDWAAVAASLASAGAAPLDLPDQSRQ
jgi:hypothetical protein